MDTLIQFLNTPFLQHPTWLWLSFSTVITVLLVLDLAVFNRKDHVIGMKESLTTCGLYAAIAIMFSVFIGYYISPDAAFTYLTGYVVEFSLSMDNMFVIALIFGSFAIPRHYQHRVLFWGILGAIIMRGSMIILGATLVSKFSWILYFFAAFLVITGLRMLFSAPGEEEETKDLTRNPLVKYLKKHHLVTNQLHGHHFFVKEYTPKSHQPRWKITPLMLALITIELADVVFAVDSVPAIFAITTDPFIVFSSNIFAILGLRSLYFALSAMMARFAYLKYGLALVLCFIGVKISLAAFHLHLPQWLALLVTIGLLAGSITYSLIKTRNLAKT